MHVPFVKGCGDPIPVPHDQPQDIVGLVEPGELASIRHLTAEHFWQVFARQHNFRTGNEGYEESVNLFDVHRLAALGLPHEFSEPVEFCFRQSSLLGKSIHGHIGIRPPVEGCPGRPM
jgi:hypothetical protein